MICSILIKIATRQNKTYLKNCFFSPPLKVANITENKAEKALRLMLMNSSPGVLDGDEYQIKIELEEDCSVQLHTQSYQRLFTMKKCAVQNTEIHLDKNASFCYLPHPTVPHRLSNFVATNKIFLSENCKLVWGEVLTCGRKLNGEEFEFTKYQNRTEIFLNGKLIIKENLLLQPSKLNVMAMGQLEGYSHQASLLFFNEIINANKVVSQVNELLFNEKDICFGVSALPVSGVIVRLLGYKGEQLFNLLQIIAAFLSGKDNNDDVTKSTSEKYVTHAD